MKKRITIEFDENDQIYIDFMKYVNENYLTLTSAIKQAIVKLLKSD